MPTPSDTFANEWTDAEAYYAAHPLLGEYANRPRAEVIRLMAIARTITALEGEVVRITQADDPTAETQCQTTIVGTVVGRALLGEIGQSARWLILVRDARQVWAIPEDQVVDVGDR